MLYEKTARRSQAIFPENIKGQNIMFQNAWHQHQMSWKTYLKPKFMDPVNNFAQN